MNPVVQQVLVLVLAQLVLVHLEVILQIGSTSGGYYTTVSQAVHSLLSNVNPQVLGMAQVYSVGFWGYCRGYVIQDDSKTKKFDNSNVNYTWCSNQKFLFQ